MNKTINKEETWYKFTILFIYLSILFWLYIIVYGPAVSFLFDQTKGQATITSIQDNGRVELYYFHRQKNRKIKLTYTCHNIPKLKKLKTKTDWAILYSAHFQEQVCIIGVDDKPNSIILIFMVILALPILSFKYWKFEEL